MKENELPAEKQEAILTFTPKDINGNLLAVYKYNEITDQDEIDWGSGLVDLEDISRLTEYFRAIANKKGLDFRVEHNQIVTDKQFILTED